MAFHEHKVSLTQGQQDKLRIAMNKKSAVSLKLDNAHLTGTIPLMLTSRQVNQLRKAHAAGTGVVINLSMKQISHMHKMVSGGFLPALAGLLASALPFITGTVLPALGAAAVGGAATYGVNKAIQAIDKKVSGNGVAGGNVPGGGYKKKGRRGKTMLTNQEISATGLFQFGQPYKRGSGLIPFGGRR